MNPRALLASWFAPILIHGQNQWAAMTRAATAKANGLDPAMYGTPFPGSTVNATTTNAGGGFLRGAVLTAVTLAAGAGGAKMLQPATPAAAPAAPPAAVQPAAPTVTPPAAAAAPDPAWDEIREEQQPDGSWKKIGQRHLKKQADGSWK